MIPAYTTSPSHPEPRITLAPPTTEQVASNSRNPDIHKLDLYDLCHSCLVI